MSDNTGNKVLGLEANQYTNACYMLILISSGFGLLGGLAGLGGLVIPGAGLFGLVGLIGLIMVLVGFFGFKDKFSNLEAEHLKYLAILFGVFFIISIILGGVLVKAGMVGVLLMILLSAIQFALFFAGYKNYKGGVVPTKESIQNTIKSGFKA